MSRPSRLRLVSGAVGGAALALAGCPQRTRLPPSGDAGAPKVVVVQRPRPVGTGARPPAHVAVVDELEPNDDAGHAQPLEWPKGIAGSLLGQAGKADEDWLQWVVGGEVPATARLEATPSPELDLSVELVGGDGQRLFVLNDGGPGAAEVVPNLAVAPGQTWFVRLRAIADPKRPPPVVAAQAAYRFAVTTAARQPGEEIEPNDRREQATLLSGDGSGFFGRRRDEDWLRLGLDPAAAGGLRLELSAVEGVAAAVRIAAAAGKTLLESRGERGEELRLRNLPLPLPDQFIVLRAESGRQIEARWLLRYAVEPLAQGCEREPNGTREQAFPVEVEGGAELLGFLWPGDVDVYQLRGAAGRPLRIELTPPPKVDLRIEQLAEKGTGLKADRGGPGKAELLELPPGSGDCFLRVSSKRNHTVFDAPYSLRVTPGAASTDGG